MVQRIIKLAGKAVGKTKSVLFADPKLLYDDERHLITEPFFFDCPSDVCAEGEYKKKGVLLIHGWTATPYEVRRLGKYLNENGYVVSGIRLKGHGTKPEDLEGVKWQAWLDDVKRGYAELKKRCDHVYVGGTSIGGSLALIFAKEQRDVAGLVVMATPYKLKFEPIVLLVADMMKKMKKKFRHKFYPPTFGLSTTITRLISYQKYPVKSAIETFEAIKEGRKDLDKITQPIFALQSTHDHIVVKKSIEHIFNGVSSKIKRKKHVHKAYHTFISDIRNEHIFQEILEFLNSN